MVEAEALHGLASVLERRLDRASPGTIIVEAIRAIGSGRLAVVSSFGTESAVLLAHVAAVDRAIPVLFADTGWLFEETIAYRDAIVARLGLSDVRTLRPSEFDVGRKDRGRELWFSDPDGCCALRKVDPLVDALRAFDGWINGRKRYQGGKRSHLPIVEVDGRRLKFNPLARVSQREIATVFESSRLPRHPLEARGFGSIGCMPCSSRTAPGESPRAGRWRGRDKTECGIHSSVK